MYASPPETTEPVDLRAPDHWDRTCTLFTVLAHHCDCPIDNGQRISFASDFTQEAFLYQHQQPDTFNAFVDPAQRYICAISDPLSWELFQLKARINNRHLPFPPAGASVITTGASAREHSSVARRMRKPLTTYAGYCDTFSIAADPASRAEARIQQRERAPSARVIPIPSLSEVIMSFRTNDVSSGTNFAFACPARPSFGAMPPMAPAEALQNAQSRAWRTTSAREKAEACASLVINEEPFLLQLAYYHTLETQRHYAQARFAPWADEDTKPQLAALITRGQHYRSRLISRGLLPEDAPWVVPPTLGCISNIDQGARGVDYNITPRRAAQVSFALNPRYNGAVRLPIRTYTENIDDAARHYINKEQRASFILLQALFPVHYFRNIADEPDESRGGGAGDDEARDDGDDALHRSLLPGDTDAERFLPRLTTTAAEPIDHNTLLERRGVGTRWAHARGGVRIPRPTKLAQRSFFAARDPSTVAHPATIAKQVRFQLVQQFRRVLGILPTTFRVHAEGCGARWRLTLVCNDPAFIHYASLLTFVDHLLEDGANADKSVPLHPFLLRLFAVRPRRHNFEHYGWEGPANGFFDLAHMYCFSRVLAHWCNWIDPYLPKGVSPDRYLCTPADSRAHFNHYASVHRFVALFSAGEGAPIYDAINERGLLANIGRFLTFRAALYIHRDAYALLQQWAQVQIAYAANIEFMRRHYWVLDHFSHALEPMLHPDNPMFIRLESLCETHNRVHGERMAVSYALDGREGLPKSTPADFAARLYRAAIDMRFIHHKLAVMLATSLANEPSRVDAPLISLDLVIEPETCDHEMLDWQQYRSTSWIRAFLAERAVAEQTGGVYREDVDRDDIQEFYAALSRISQADAVHSHTFAAHRATHLDADDAESVAAELSRVGGRTEEVFRAARDPEVVLRESKDRRSAQEEKKRSRATASLAPTTYREMYYRRMLFQAHRLRLDPDLAVCLPPAQRAVLRVGEPVTEQRRPWDPAHQPFDLEGVTFTSGPASLHSYLPNPAHPLPPPPPQEANVPLPSEADLAGVDPSIAVPIPWIHTMAVQIARLLPDDLPLRVYSASTASTLHPESRFSPSYSVTVEEETQQTYLVRLDACEMHMLYMALSCVLPDELTHDAGEDDSVLEQIERGPVERRAHRSTHIRADSAACSSGAWSVDAKAARGGTSGHGGTGVCKVRKADAGPGRARAEQHKRNGLGMVLHYDASTHGPDGRAWFVDASGRLRKFARRGPRRHERCASDTMHGTMDQRQRPIAPSVRKYMGRQYRAYYVHNGLGAPSRFRVAFFCHGTYSLLIRACDRARFVETVRRQIAPGVLDFGRIGFRLLPVDRFREEWGLRRRVAYTAADEVAPFISTARTQHTNLDIGIERAQGYARRQQQRQREHKLFGKARFKGDVVRPLAVPSRTFRFPRRSLSTACEAEERNKRGAYRCNVGSDAYYTNPAAYWGLVDWLSPGGGARSGDFRTTGDADALNPLLTVLAYLDAATSHVRRDSAPIDYFEHDYLGITGSEFRELPICVESSGECALTLSSCLFLKI